MGEGRKEVEEEEEALRFFLARLLPLFLMEVGDNLIPVRSYKGGKEEEEEIAFFPFSDLCGSFLFSETEIRIYIFWGGGREAGSAFDVA